MLSVDVHYDGFIHQDSPDNERRLSAEGVYELHHFTLAQFASLAGGGDAVQELFGILVGEGRPFDSMRFAVSDDDRRFAHPQF